MTDEAGIVWIERGLDGTALTAGLILLLAAPAARVLITWPMLVVLGGVVLLASGLARDLARIALEGRPVATAPDRHPGELRLCLESTLGLAAVAAGLGWRFWSAGSSTCFQAKSRRLRSTIARTKSAGTRRPIVPRCMCSTTEAGW